MRVAIYARSLAENSNETSINNQIKICQKKIEANGFTCDKKHIYIDESIEGSTENRPGLQALEKAIENREVDAIAIDDLLKLSKNNNLFSIVSKINYYQITVIVVSEIKEYDSSTFKLWYRRLKRFLAGKHS